MNKNKTSTAVVSSELVRPLVKYLHTICGKPGDYDGYQICYAVESRPIHLVPNLRQIVKEQKLSEKHRTADGFENHTSQYGYKRVYVA